MPKHRRGPPAVRASAVSVTDTGNRSIHAGTSTRLVYTRLHVEYARRGTATATATGDGSSEHGDQQLGQQRC